METWQEVTVHVHRDAQEAVSHVLIETGSQGVAIADSETILGKRTALGSYTQMWSSLT